MANLDALRENIMNVIQLENYNEDSIIEVLEPIPVYTNNPVFKNNIDQIVDILTKDRDGNQKFSIDDLKLLGNDLMSVSSLITAVFLLIGAIPTIKLEYTVDQTEELVFKLLAFVFLVIIPKHIGHDWSLEDKEQVVSVSLTIYNMIKSSQLVQNLINKVSNWLKSKGFCKCMYGEEHPAVEAKLPKVKLELQAAMNNVRDKALLLAEIKELKSRMV